MCWVKRSVFYSELSFHKRATSSTANLIWCVFLSSSYLGVGFVVVVVVVDGGSLEEEINKLFFLLGLPTTTTSRQKTRLLLCLDSF